MKFYDIVNMQKIVVSTIENNFLDCDWRFLSGHRKSLNFLNYIFSAFSMEWAAWVAFFCKVAQIECDYASDSANNELFGIFYFQ